MNSGNNFLREKADGFSTTEDIQNDDHRETGSGAPASSPASPGTEAEYRPDRRMSENRPFSKPVPPREENPLPGDTAQQDRDIASLRALLDKQFEGDPDEADPRIGDGAVKAPPPPRKSAARVWTGRIVKTAIGLAVLVVVGVMPAQRLLQVSSVEAVLNAPLVTVRAPISGVMSDPTGPLRAGRQIAADNALVTITNPRADISRVVAYSDRLETLQREQVAKAARLDAFNELESVLTKRVATFTDNRILQLQARQEQADARIEGAVAALEKAKASRQRAAGLAGKGITSTADLETAERDATIAEEKVKELRAEKNELQVELSALNQGTFLGDDYNDRPQSAQRLDEVQSTIAGLRADLKAGEVQIDWAKKTLEEEKRRHDVESTARIKAPISGSIWQVLATPGEHVEAGEPLFNILDCSKLMVTAVVSESVYNRLVKGTPAAFHFREGGEPLRGEVILLSGMATASSEFAITPAALTREAYRVTVSLDNPYAIKGICSIGRTGRVVFGRDAY